MELLSGKLCFDGGEFGAGGVDALLETLFHSGVPGGGHGGKAAFDGAAGRGGGLRRGGTVFGHAAVSADSAQ